MRHRLRSELYHAALQYGVIGRFFLAVKARHVEFRDGPSRGSGGDVPEAKARWLQAELLRLEAPLRRYEGFGALRQLAIFERHIPPEAEKAVIRPLYVLAGMTGHLGSRVAASGTGGEK